MSQARRDMPRGGENTKKTDFSAFSAMRDLLSSPAKPVRCCITGFEVALCNRFRSPGQIDYRAAAGLAVKHAPDLVWL
jgi:hypothetical protein